MVGLDKGEVENLVYQSGSAEKRGVVGVEDSDLFVVGAVLDTIVFEKLDGVFSEAVQCMGVE